jgi:AcrR family transcriptional regulator
MSWMESGPIVLSGQQTRPGRKRDTSRDRAILQATLEVLAETGYERMTTDMVAARAKTSKATMYRRWPSKAELVIEAVESLRDEPVTAVPDTGTLRRDLAALIETFQSPSTTRKFQIMAGLLSILPRDPDLARVVQRRIVQPGTAVMRLLLERAQKRGEIDPGRDLDTLALVAPAMVAYRLIITGEQVDRQFLTSVINEVLAPASSQ